MIEISTHLADVHREVGGRILPAGQARVVSLSRRFAAGIDDVWDACTRAERLPRWFLPVSGDLVEGGRYQLQGQAGGRVTRCDPPHGFDATWEVGGEVSAIEVRLTDEGDGHTRFRLDHIGPADDDRWRRYGPGAVGVGWDGALLGLTLHLTTGATVDPAEVASWSASEDGRRFVQECSREWGEADVRAGADPERARAAARATADFYSGSAEATAGEPS